MSTRFVCRRKIDLICGSRLVYRLLLLIAILFGDGTCTCSACKATRATRYRGLDNVWTFNWYRDQIYVSIDVLLATCSEQLACNIWTRHIFDFGNSAAGMSLRGEFTLKAELGDFIERFPNRRNAMRQH